MNAGIAGTESRARLWRVLLVLLGCLPMVLVYVPLSLGVMLFAFPAVLFGGHPGNIIFVLWWALGTYGLMALFYSCATYRKRPSGPRPWQLIGLIVGVVSAVPTIALGYTHGLEIVATILAVGTAAFVFATERKAEVKPL